MEEGVASIKIGTVADIMGGLTTIPPTCWVEVQVRCSMVFSTDCPHFGTQIKIRLTITGVLEIS